MDSGLVCVLSTDPQSREHIDVMERRLVPVADSVRESIDAGPFALRLRTAAWISSPVARDPATGTALVLLGSAWQGPRHSSAVTLLAGFLRDGNAAFTGLGGSFAVLVWLPQTGTVLVATDRLATRKVYLWSGAGATLISTELRPLLAHPQVSREIDASAVEQLLITSHLTDARSLIRDIRVLDPGTVTRFDRDGVTPQRYWSARISPRGSDSIDRWADRLGEALAAAVAARCDGARLLLPLSGGLDARSVAAFIPPGALAGASACTYGPPYCYDVRYARRMARALGVPFSRLSIPDDFFRRYLEPVQLMCDGEVSIEALPVYRLLGAGEPGQTVLTGFLGDVLSGSHLLQLDHCVDSRERIDALWQWKYLGKGCSEELLARIMLPERYAAVRGATRRSMEAALVAAEAETFDEKSLIVELYQRQSRYVSYFSRLLGSRYRVENPFLDVDVIDAFLALPLEFRRNQRAYRRMLVRHAPRLAAIAECKTHRPVSWADTHGVPHAQEVKHTSRLPAGVEWRVNRVRKFTGTMIARATAGWLGSHNRDYYVHHDDSIRRVDPGWFRARLLENRYTDSWFHTSGLKMLLDEHLNGRRDHSTRINNIVAFLTWQESLDSR